MKIEEVPQDKKQFKDGDKAPKKLMYVTNQDGSYTQKTSAGWEAENLALEQAWQDIDEQLLQSKEAVKNGKSSPIAYYMILNRMDIAILAKYVGKWQWQVKRHLQPSVFNTLSEKVLLKYAQAFNISLDALKNVV
ncbi:MAG: hypothetical protein KBF25_04085 [Chitinophagaceae bacterium]|jgi:hypothetical protein|nr:hypothetical protein [Bacteroidota bacterium]MBP9932848.1 hypothetical protein [Chitinophagaceae bacterium]